MYYDTRAKKLHSVYYFFCFQLDRATCVCVWATNQPPCSILKHYTFWETWGLLSSNLLHSRQVEGHEKRGNLTLQQQQIWNTHTQRRDTQPGDTQWERLVSTLLLLCPSSGCCRALCSEGTSPSPLWPALGARWWPHPPLGRGSPLGGWTPPEHSRENSMHSFFEDRILISLCAASSRFTIQLCCRDISDHATTLTKTKLSDKLNCTVFHTK